MEVLDFDYFYRQLEAGVSVDETCFYFTDDEDKTERYLGFLPQYDKPYWVGYCDIPEGTEFHTAEELVNAKIYHGKSLKERWDKIRIVSIMGTYLEEWQVHFKHV